MARSLVPAFLKGQTPVHVTVRLSLNQAKAHRLSFDLAV